MICKNFNYIPKIWSEDNYNPKTGKKKKKPSEVFKSLRCVDTHHCEDSSASLKEKIQAIGLSCHENEPVCLK